MIGIPLFFYYTIPHELADLTVLDTTLLHRRGNNTSETVLMFCYCFLDTLIATSLTRVNSRVQNSIVQLSLSCRFFGLSPLQAPNSLYTIETVMYRISAKDVVCSIAK